MWRPFLAAFLLVGTLSCGIYLQNTVVNKTEQIEENIPSSIAPNCSAALELAYADFKNASNLFSTIYIHSALDEITDSFEKCFSLLGVNNKDQYFEEARHLKFLLRRLSVLDKPNVESIF